MDEVLIVNASPLIFLGNAGRLELLQALDAPRILVPDAVYNEVALSEHSDKAASALTCASWIETYTPTSIPDTVIEWDLGSGESAVIATAMEIGDARPVIDDLSGRKCALSVGFKVIGTIGIVIFAHRRGVVKNPRQILLDLRANGMWLSDSVIDNALRLAGITP